MSILSHLHQVMTVRTVRATRDAVGGQVETKTLRHSCMCLVAEISGGEREMLGRMGVVATHRIFFEPYVTMSERDEVRVGDRVFDVARVVNPHSYDRHQYAEVVERT